MMMNDWTQFYLGGFSEVNEFGKIKRFLENKKLFKTLSLFLSQSEGIKVPPTALLLSVDIPLIKFLFKKWGAPLMLRMDYSGLPKRKYIGGIPVYTFDMLIRLSNFLIMNGFYPLLHPHYDRFDDEVSVGLILDKSSHDSIIEAVGKGFDASDLRLGSTIPHEIISFNNLSFNVEFRKIVDQSQYLVSVKERREKIRQLVSYIEFANRHGELLTSLKDIEVKDVLTSMKKLELNKEYTKISFSHLKKLMRESLKIQRKVLSQLPESQQFIASFSFLPQAGWLLWDIYGSWYKR